MAIEKLTTNSEFLAPGPHSESIQLSEMAEILFELDQIDEA